MTDGVLDNLFDEDIAFALTLAAKGNTAFAPRQYFYSEDKDAGYSWQEDR